jgi:hypothetical protein
MRATSEAVISKEIMEISRKLLHDHFLPESERTRLKQRLETLVKQRDQVREILNAGSHPEKTGD